MKPLPAQWPSPDDHQNKTDIGAAIARRWIDVDGVDAIVDVPNSAIALAVQEIAIAASISRVWA